MKNLLNFCGILLLLILSVNYVSAQTNEEVVALLALVKETRAAIEKNAEHTFESILFGDHPYKNEDNPSLYVFVLDTDLTVAAHPIMPHMAGNNLKGKPDLKGKMFREEMLEKALKDGKGWVKYHYFNPKTRQPTLKISYFELANGSDGKKYIVGSGRYLNE
jgi:polar amino acid transport system substrate-binding protein